MLRVEDVIFRYSRYTGLSGGHRHHHAAMLVLDKDDPPLIKTPEE